MKNLAILLIFVFTSSSLASEQYIAGEYYHCKDERRWSGTFGFQQRNGTIDNPNNYDPKQPSRDYIYFLFSIYPIPMGYAPIIDESETEIFLEGTHYPFYSQTEKEEPFFAIINKEDLSIKGKSLDYKTETRSFKTVCSLNIEDVRK
jgi:hypothetical protein